MSDFCWNCDGFYFVGTTMGCNFKHFLLSFKKKIIIEAFNVPWGRCFKHLHAFTYLVLSYLPLGLNDFWDRLQR